MLKPTINAESFYSEILNKKLILPNSNIEQRLTEVPHWQFAFSTILDHCTKFRLIILDRNTKKWSDILNKYQFPIDFKKEIIAKIEKIS